MPINFKKVIKNFEALKRNLPKQLANEGQRFFLKSFDEESWEGQRWKPRIANRTVRKQKDVTRKLLVRSGRLRRALSTSKREQTFERIRWDVFVTAKDDFNYAEVHNNGGPRAPKRRFIGRNKNLDTIFRKKINDEVSKCFK